MTRSKRGPAATQIITDDPPADTLTALEFDTEEVNPHEISPPPAPIVPGPPPIPTAYRAEWWPAAVVLPDGRNIRLAKVYATREGLYVYTAVPAQHARAAGLNPEFFSPIHYDKTPRPGDGYAAQRAGFTIHTVAGRVVVQPLTGCGCSHKALKAWRPMWATKNEAWEA